MSISALLGFVSLVGFVALVAGIALAVSNAAQQRSTRPGVIIAVVGLVVGIAFSVISQGVIIVQPQQVAVIFDVVRGELLSPREQGIHIIVPVVQEPTFYSIAQAEYTMSGSTTEGARSGNDAVVARTSDGQEVLIDATIIYSINPDGANLVHQRWENRFEDGLIRPTVRGVVRNEVSRYGVEEVYSTQRDALRDGIFELISTRFAEEGFIVTDFLIRDIEFTEEYAASVEQKQIAEQDRLRQEQEAARIRIEAEGNRDAAIFQAEGERQSQIENATGEAEAIRLRAEAEADAILLTAEAQALALELINSQISQNPQLIQWQYVANLSDNIELILLPSDSPFLFDFGALSQGTFTAPGGGSADPLDSPAPEESSVPDTGAAAEASSEAASKPVAWGGMILLAEVL